MKKGQEKPVANETGVKQFTMPEILALKLKLNAQKLENINIRLNQMQQTAMTLSEARLRLTEESKREASKFTGLTVEELGQTIMEMPDDSNLLIIRPAQNRPAPVAVPVTPKAPPEPARGTKTDQGEGDQG
jgi:hypothetical protein